MVTIHIGCYVKCNFEKINTTSEVYGCPEHGRFSNNSDLFKYCYQCGKKLETIEESHYGFPNVHGIIGTYSRLGRILSGGNLYLVSNDYDDGTNFSNQDDEVVLDMSVMANSMLAFHLLYKVELEKLRNYGSIELHFGVLFLDEV